MQVVVVGKPDNDKIDGKKTLDITIGVFFDGTLNNMYGRYKERHFTRINYEKVCNNRHYSASDRNTRLL